MRDFFIQIMADMKNPDSMAVGVWVMLLDLHGITPCHRCSAQNHYGLALSSLASRNGPAGSPGHLAFYRLPVLWSLRIER
jgi:hypothetical protein